jgi:pimeloyl-ACP methyl ester carboxylesterase
MTEEPLPRYQRSGAGAPMVLLHGIGHRRQMWQPVVDRLHDGFDMVGVDLPGFGESAASASADPSPEWLADRVAALMDSLGWPTAHLIGNSLGCWVSLGLARRGRARSVTVLMPAGLWQPHHGSDSLRHRVLFGLWRLSVRIAGVGIAVRSPIVRTIGFVGLFGRPWRIPPEVAQADAANLRDGGISRTMFPTLGRSFTGGQDIDVPVTVVLGARDPLIRRRDLDLSQLPAGVRLTVLKGAGHVPTWDDPDAVTSLIDTTARAVGRAPAAAAVPSEHSEQRW